MAQDLLPQFNVQSFMPESPAIAQADSPSYTWQVDMSTGRIIGYVDNLQALTQSVSAILNVEKYRWRIYNETMGASLLQLIGESYQTINNRIGSILNEALLVDDRITSLEALTVEQTGSESVHVSFTINSVFGNIAMRIAVGAIESNQS